MIAGTSAQTAETTLIVKRVFTAPRQEVFDAWTQPQFLKKWFAPSDDYDNPSVEVDLRKGGKYRIVMRHRAKGVLSAVCGEYREVLAPEKLVFTWAWEGEDSGETLVTVNFRDLGTSTEISLKHELFQNTERRDKHTQGWNGCLVRLARAL